MSLVPVDRLRKTFDPALLECDSTEELEPLATIIGQDRAVKSLRFGLAIREIGFNIYMAGVPGTGKTTAVRRFFEAVARDQPVPRDWCYVNDFRDPSRPKALSLPPGRAKELQADVPALVQAARDEIRKAFESEEYAAKREETLKDLQEQKTKLIAAMNQRAQEEGFIIQARRTGMLTIPVLGGEPLSDEQFTALDAEQQEKIAKKRHALQGELQGTLRQIRNVDRGAQEALRQLDQEVALYAVGPLIDDLQDNYEGLGEVVAYLDEVREDILQSLALFTGDEAEQPATLSPAARTGDRLFEKYEVNVLVDNSELQGAPVVMELNPTYNNLFGRVEKEAQFGALVTDFTMIRGGSLHRANGGYLVLSAEEVLRNPFSWDGLKRALRNREIAIEEAPESSGYVTYKSLQPVPIPHDVKVVLIGQPRLYHLLYDEDEDFGELFKVKADFDTEMDRTDENVRDYAAFVCTLCCEEGLKHLDRSALARLVEFSSRLTEDQEKLSTRFGEVSDVIREASFYASQDKAPYVTAAHVARAVEERIYRSNLVQEKVLEMIEHGTLMIDVEGERVGQVNGLSIISLGVVDFARPSKITASISLGRDGLIDIEREAKLGGDIHTKGVLILSGYFAQKYAEDKPLSLTCRLVFEQSYSGVDGDSASSAEMYAILSGLSGLPIKQGIAATGSVNQKGEVQAIGGVNEKIEGFFEVCKAKGLTGEQGVMIPESNVRDLMLKEEIVEGVREGRFHVWAVNTIDAGIEVLTGVRAGERQEDGTFEEGTVSDRVDKRLRELAETLSEFVREEKDHDNPGEGCGEEEEQAE
ncbi:MAG TPA: AAA family ATPase [Anaerolineae bacterium]|nr:AAA family ATPase [Anaerolineae bacterium]